MTESFAVMGVDPGLVCTAVAVCESGARFDVVHRENIKTSKAEPDGTRVAKICSAILRALRIWNPLVVAIEGYEYQGERSRQRNMLRVGRLAWKLEGLAQGWMSSARPEGHGAVYALGKLEINRRLGALQKDLIQANSVKARVKRALALRLGTNTLKGTNEHDRDAIAVAMVAADKWRLERAILRTA